MKYFWRLLEIAFFLKLSAEAKVPTVKNGETQTITCTGGSFILITSASYSAGSCFSPTALTIVQGLCDDLTTCSVTADDTTFTDSTCDASQSEKLKISYVCQKRKFIYKCFC